MLGRLNDGIGRLKFGSLICRGNPGMPMSNVGNGGMLGRLNDGIGRASVGSLILQLLIFRRKRLVQEAMGYPVTP
jgi:hypothetical protein